MGLLVDGKWRDKLYDTSAITDGFIARRQCSALESARRQYRS
ncbi:MAG: hypothetical protein GPOALKHO_001600 [Sodalis sp.]|nr:MAG: hypothetical protein GPOALKHO_001600 [Sodalis sp.]